MSAPPRELLTALPELVAPGRTALLVIDMQNDFCADGGYVDRVIGKDVAPCQAVAAPIAKLAAAARDAGVPVVWVRADYAPEHLHAPVLAKQAAMGIEAVCCAPGSWGYDFFGVAPEPGEMVVDKHRYSAFTGTGLDAALRARGIETLVIAGVQTNVCIESTFRDAFNLGYYLVIPEDCVASHTPPLHDAALMNFRFLFGSLVRSDEVIAQWAGT